MKKKKTLAKIFPHPNRIDEEKKKKLRSVSQIFCFK